MLMGGGGLEEFAANNEALWWWSSGQRSNDPSSNPAKVYNFPVKMLLNSTKINKKVAEVGPLKEH